MTIEVVQTRNAGWAWRCHRCDITRANLQELEAASEARQHSRSIEHQLDVLPGEPEHGTLARYATRPFLCRCTPCREAMATYQRQRRRQVAAKP